LIEIFVLGSTDYVLSLLHWDNLWQKGNFEEKGFPNFLFSRKAPSPEWKLVSDIRKEIGDKEYDRKVRKYFTLIVDEPELAYQDINVVWNKFMELFICFTPIVTYSEAWKDYYRQALQEFYDDGVQYLEFRGTLPEVSFHVIEYVCKSFIIFSHIIDL
jgi:adenosine deaminase CECR1